MEIKCFCIGRVSGWNRSLSFLSRQKKSCKHPIKHFVDVFSLHFNRVSTDCPSNSPHAPCRPPRMPSHNYLQVAQLWRKGSKPRCSHHLLEEKSSVCSCPFPHILIKYATEHIPCLLKASRSPPGLCGLCWFPLESFLEHYSFVWP